jgi:hypothetical protein
MRQKMVQLKMAPSDSLKERTPMNTEGDPKYIPQPFVRLSRTLGSISYAIASKPNREGSYPGLWIEQDQFVIRKIRMPSMTTIEAEDYQKYANGFHFPKLRTYTWDDQSMTVQARSVKSLGRPDPKGWEPSSNLPVKFSGTEALRDFYLRFR